VRESQPPGPFDHDGSKKMDPSFKLIYALKQFLNPLHVRWFLSGGWAIDFHLNQITRQRGDLDISVPFSTRLVCIEFFLNQGWQIEAKLGNGFKTLQKLSDYQKEIRYFWSFPKKVDFISEYINENGNRRIAYNREVQDRLDYIEVFFDQIEGQHLIYRRDPQVRENISQAILERNGLRYLAPQWVLLFKSKNLSEKNIQDFDAAVASIDVNARAWLGQSLSRVYGDSHPWLNQLLARM
jgi:hypothetical protein